MFTKRSSIYIIAAALVALLTMQGMWVYYAIRQERKFLDEGARQAGIEAVDVLEQREDSKLLVMNMDTILEQGLRKTGKKEKNIREVKVVMSDGEESITVSDSFGTGFANAYSYSTCENGIQAQGFSSKIIINASPKEKFKIKMRDYDHLLKKIVHQSHPKNLNIRQRINLDELYRLLEKNLRARGIDLRPELAVKDKSGNVIFSSGGYKEEAGIVLPLFSKDIFFQDNRLHIFFPETLGYIFKKSVGVVMMSVAVTILLIIIIVLLYRKMLTEQKLNQYKNDFINNLTHELKTPLATISLANSNISKSAGYSGQVNLQQYTGIIEEEGKKLNSHIEKVLGLSLLEREKNFLQLERCDVHALLNESLEKNISLIHSVNGSAEIKLNALQHHVMADKFHLFNAISNILDNAVKYRGQSLKIVISTTNTADKLLVSVKDNGIGISKEQQRYIFDKFFRVTYHDLHNTKGFGIGLSYVKQVIEMFGGTIEVNSQPGEGAEFIISLPYAKD